jgi:ATP-dependent DNA ligase
MCILHAPAAGQRWNSVHEVKHGGFRILVRKLGERAKVWSRRGADFTDRFLGIAEAVRGLNVGRALIDGEAVVLRDDGRSDFHALLTKRVGAQASLVAFDLLRLEGVDLRQRPIEARRETLRWLVDGVSGMLFSEALAAEGAVGRCQSKFYTAGWRSGAGYRHTVFAHESPTRSAGSDAENGLYLFALTVPSGSCRCGPQSLGPGGD